MMSSMRPPFVFLFTLIMILTICYLCKCEARDSISSKNPLRYGGTLVSSGKTFELGFFTPEGNENKYNNSYVGIWYYMLEPRTVVWVANRDKPLPGSCGLFGVAEDGNIKLWCGNGGPFPVTNLTKASNRTLQLLDSGNLVLFDGQSRSILWQSFEYPTDTFLPGMKLNDDVLISWKSPSDPGKGNYTFRQGQGGFFIQNGPTFHWKSGVSGLGITKDKLPLAVRQLLDSATDQKSQTSKKINRSVSISYSNFTTNSSYTDSRLVMNSSGKIQYFYKSVFIWAEPDNPCSIFDVCGNSAVCNTKSEPICQCPQGFKPVSSEDWKAGQYSDGCDRESKMCNDTDSFLKLFLMDLTEAIPFDEAQTEEECKRVCLSNCRCKAYSYIEDVNITASARAAGKSATKCWIWANELGSFHQDYNRDLVNISLRVPPPSVAMLNLRKSQGKLRTSLGKDM